MFLSEAPAVPTQLMYLAKPVTVVSAQAKQLPPVQVLVAPPIQAFSLPVEQEFTTHPTNATGHATPEAIVTNTQPKIATMIILLIFIVYFVQIVFLFL